MASYPLAERDINQATATTSPQIKQQPKSMEYHRQMLESRLQDKQQQQTYISPSDNILSPASQKLAAFKNKRNEGAKQRTLFARTMQKNANAASKPEGFADIARTNSTVTEGSEGS